jgi:hypothetical protein
MNRKSFLRKLGIGLGVAVVAPRVFAEKENFGRNLDVEQQKKMVLANADAIANIPDGYHIKTAEEYFKEMDDMWHGVYFNKAYLEAEFRTQKKIETEFWKLINAHQS